MSIPRSSCHIKFSNENGCFKLKVHPTFSISCNWQPGNMNYTGMLGIWKWHINFCYWHQVASILIPFHPPSTALLGSPFDDPNHTVWSLPIANDKPKPHNLPTMFCMSNLFPLSIAKSQIMQLDRKSIAFHFELASRLDSPIIVFYYYFSFRAQKKWMCLNANAAVSYFDCHPHRFSRGISNDEIIFVPTLG